MDIGGAIKFFREELGISQTELGNKCGISQTSLSQIECNVTQIRDANLKKICKHLKVTIGQVYIQALTKEDFPVRKRGDFDFVKSVMIKYLLSLPQ